MRYAYIMPNDFLDGQGICVSVWLQGCPFHCKGCHNPDTWSFSGGKEISYPQLFDQLERAMTANGVHRNFSILGGQPLCPENVVHTWALVRWCRLHHPTSKIYLWTGYVYEDMDTMQQDVADAVDVLIDGPYIQELRDITLPLCGSSNQRVIRRNMDER